MKKSDAKIRTLIHAFEQLKYVTEAAIDDNHDAFQALDETPHLLITNEKQETTVIACGTTDQMVRLLQLAIEGFSKQAPETIPPLADFFVKLLEGKVKTETVKTDSNVIQFPPTKLH
jgi:hypothetical protein